MYQIIGSDGKEYGPISPDVLQQWLREGRVNARTQVKPPGATEWQALGSMPEFSDAFPPPFQIPPGSSVTTGGTQPSKMSVLAIASLVMGILGLFCLGITSLIGLVCGIVALVKINNSAGRLSGKGLAIAGIVTSGVLLLLLPIFAAMLLPALSKAKQKAQTIHCVNNVKQLGLAVRMYSLENDDMFPFATNWCDLILTNVGSAKVFQCSAEPGVRCGYSFNSKLSGVKEDEINPQTVLFFESTAGWNASGGPEMLASHGHSTTSIVVGYADGSVVQLPRSRLDSLRWDP